MPSSRPLRADARRNREALLTAAHEALLDAGEVHVEEIARRAGVSVGTLYRHFETREALIAEVYRREVTELCAAPARLLAQHAPDAALRAFLLLIVEHAAVGRGMGEALESIMATDSPVFDDAREEMARALDLLLTAGATAGLVRGDAGGRLVLRALGGICGMRAEGWKDDAFRIVGILYDGLRHDAADRGRDPVSDRG